MSLKENLMIYIYNKMTEMEMDKENLLAMRFKGSFDSLDIYEIMRSDIRIQCWNEFLDDIYKIVFSFK